jgi:copper resistance protein C
VRCVTPATSLTPVTSSIGRALSAALLLLTTVLATALALDATTTPAHAHVTLVESDPAADAQLGHTPPGITLVFAGDLEPRATVTVIGPDGTEQQSGTAIVAGSTVIQRISDLGGRGQYSLSYSVKSTDGHKIEGEQRFAVGEPVVPAEEPTGRSTLSPEGSDGSTTEPVESSAAADDDGSGSTVVWVVVGAGVLAAVGGGLWWRRTRVSA